VLIEVINAMRLKYCYCNATAVKILSYLSIDPVCKSVAVLSISLYTLLYIKPDKDVRGGRCVHMQVASPV
jgi:hypothetical protein